MAEKTVSFRGQTVALKYPLYALAKLEEQGIELADLSDKISINTVILLTWAGLICEFPDATVDEVGMAFEMSNVKELSEAVQAAMKIKGK